VAFDDVLPNEAFVDVVGLDGCAVSWIVGGGDVPATTVQFTVVVAVPHLLLTFSTKEWGPTPRLEKVAGLSHSTGAAPSREHDWSYGIFASQLNPATAAVVVEEGYEVSTSDGALPPAAPLALFQIVSVTSTSAADANTSKLRVCVMAVCGGLGVTARGRALPTRVLIGSVHGRTDPPLRGGRHLSKERVFDCSECRVPSILRRPSLAPRSPWPEPRLR